MYEKLEGPTGDSTRHALSGLSIAMLGQGNKSIAAQLATRSENMAQSLPAGNATSDAAILGGLASVAEGNGKYAEAESLYKRALAADEQSLGLEAPDVAIVLQNLGCLYRDREQFNITQAEPLLKRALVIREKALGPELPIPLRLSATCLCSIFMKRTLQLPRSLLDALSRFKKKSLD